MKPKHSLKPDIKPNGKVRILVIIGVAAVIKWTENRSRSSSSTQVRTDCDITRITSCGQAQLMCRKCDSGKLAAQHQLQDCSAYKKAKKTN